MSAPSSHLRITRAMVLQLSSLSCIDIVLCVMLLFIVAMSLFGNMALIFFLHQLKCFRPTFRACLALITVFDIGAFLSRFILTLRDLLKGHISAPISCSADWYLSCVVSVTTVTSSCYSALLITQRFYLITDPIVFHNNQNESFFVYIICLSSCAILMWVLNFLLYLPTKFICPALVAFLSHDISHVFLAIGYILPNTYTTVTSIRMMYILRKQVSECNELTRTCLLICVCQVLFTLPISTIILSAFFIQIEWITSSSPAIIFFKLFSLSNHGLNFYILIATSNTFREQVKNIIRCSILVASRS